MRVLRIILPISLLLCVSAARPTEQSVKGLELVQQYVHQYVPARAYQFTITFPEVIAEEKTTEHTINNHIQRIASHALDEFHKRAVSINNRQPALGFRLSVMRLGYKVHLNDDGLLTMVFSKYVNYANAPQAYRMQLAFNYQYKLDQYISFKDVFEDEKQTKSFLNNSIKSQYKGAKFEDQHLDNFVITQNGVEFLFNEYAAGVKNIPKNISFTWEDLKPYLNPNFRK